jgi:hypothetical protein
MTIYRFKAVQILLVCALTTTAPYLQAETDGMYEISGRLNLVGATGEPSNDILGLGLIVHRKLSDDWYLGVSLEHASKFDVERPNELLDINSVDEIDAIASMNMITVVAERRYTLESNGWIGFWNVGAGIADIDVDDADGDVEGGGRFDIETSPDTEFVLIGSAGLLQRLGENWSARYEATLEQHFADWEVTDRVTSRTDSYDDYLVSGVRVGLNYRF